MGCQERKPDEVKLEEEVQRLVSGQTWHWLNFPVSMRRLPFRLPLPNSIATIKTGDNAIRYDSRPYRMTRQVRYSYSKHVVY